MPDVPTPDGDREVHLDPTTVKRFNATLARHQADVAYLRSLTHHLQPGLTFNTTITQAAVSVGATHLLPDRAAPHAAVGPIPPDRFAWGEGTATELPALQYVLLCALWDGARPRQPAHESAVIARVYTGRKMPSDPARAIEQLRRRTQESLDYADILLMIHVVNAHWSLTPTGT